MNYKYSVVSLTCLDHYVSDRDFEFKNIVVKIEYSLTGTSSDNIEATHYSMISIDDLSQVDPLTFVEYEDLKEDQIIEWIEAFLDKNPGHKEHMLEQITKKIDRQRNQTTSSGYDLPWSDGPPETDEPSEPDGPSEPIAP